MPFDKKDPELNEDGTPKVDPTQPVVTPTPVAPAANEHNKVFLVAGERAFGDAESVVKKIESADAHIITLEAEGKVNREALEAATGEIERLKKISDSLDGQTQPGKPDQTDQMSNDQLAAHAASLAVGLINQNKTVEEQNLNLAGAEAKAKEAYGETYISKIGEIAQSLNMTLKAVDELGKSSPAAFGRLFLPATSGTPHQPTTSSVNAPIGTEQQNDPAKPVNIVKMREGERMSIVAQKMKDAGVPGYQ